MYWVPKDRVDFTEPRKRRYRLPEWGGQTWVLATLALSSPSSLLAAIEPCPGDPERGVRLCGGAAGPATGPLGGGDFLSVLEEKANQPVCTGQGSGGN